MKDDMIPQLMPLMWLCSVFVINLIFLTYINMYYYKDMNSLVEVDNKSFSVLFKFLW